MNGRHQRGMAIISALLIVTVVAVIAAGLIARQGAYIRGLESEQLRIRASWMLRGGLEWSRQLLLEDSRRDHGDDQQRADDRHAALVTAVHGALRAARSRCRR